MFTLEEFNSSLLEEIKMSASIDGSTNIEEFIKYTTDIMIDSGEIEDFNYLQFEGVGRRGKSILIFGYSYNSLDNCFSLYTCPGINYSEVETLTQSDIEKWSSRALAFISDADYIKDNAEESSDGYGLAYDLVSRYNKATDYIIDKYKVYIITNKILSNKVKEIKSSDLNSKPVIYSIWDLGRIYQIIQSGQGKEEILIDLNEFIEDGLPCLPASKTNSYEAYLCNIPGKVLADLYNVYGSRLLEGNVRSFLQTKGKVNKGIRNTILNNPTMFFAYNNGIAATAHSIKTEVINNTLCITEIVGLQIVNGGQTTASLASALLNDKKDASEEQIKKIFVPMKLSVVDQENMEELIPNISRFANTQNKVSDADLWSNHPFHIRFEDFSRRIPTPAVDGKQYGTYWYYERANGQYRQQTYKATQTERRKFETSFPSNQMFKKVDLAKYWCTMQCQPNITSAGGTKAFNTFATYVSKNWEINQDEFNKEMYINIIAMAIMFKETDKIVKNQPWFNSYKANIVAYTIAKIIDTINLKYPTYTVPYRKIWNKQHLDESWVEIIEKVSKQMYEHLVSENRGVENVTEWAKRDACWQSAKLLSVTFSDSFVDSLEFKENEVDRRIDARKSQKENVIIAYLTDVVNFGTENWRELINWNESHKALLPKEIDFVNLAIKIEKGKIPSDRQAKVIMEVLNHAREEGFPK